MKKLNDNQIENACRRYINGEPGTTIATSHNISPQALYGLLKRRHIQCRSQMDAQRKCKIDESVFDNITESSAYWIGFLMADGCVSLRKNMSTQITLALSPKDKEHLERFRSFMQSNHKIIEVTSTNATYSPRFQYSFKSNKVASALARYGVLPDKTFTASVKQLQMNRHFWRGVIDGDGSVGAYPSGFSLRLVGSHSLLSQFLTFVKFNLPSCNVTLRPHKKKTFIVGLCGKYAVLLHSLLYKDCSTFLPRKRHISTLVAGLSSTSQT